MSLDDRLGRAADEAVRLFDDAAVPRFTPPRRRVPPAAVVATAMVGASVLAAVALGSNPGSDLETVAPTPSSTTTSSTVTSEAVGVSIRPAPVPLEIEQPVPLRVFTVDTRDRGAGEVAVVDLEAGTSTVYPAGAADISGLLSRAVMTSRRDLVVSTFDQGAFLFSGDLTVADLEIDPDREPIAGIVIGTDVVPTPDGDALWVVGPGTAYDDVRVDTIVNLVELPSGRTLASFATEPNAYPAGATDAGLVLNTTERGPDTRDIWVTEPGSEQVVIVAADGTLTEVGPGRALATAADTIVRRVCASDAPETCELLIGDAVGSVTRPSHGTWSPEDGPTIPSDGMPLHPISPDGTSMLVAFGERPDANGTPSSATLYAVDLRDGSSRAITTLVGGYPMATWTADGRWIAVINGSDITLYDDEDLASSFTVELAIPDAHYPFAAG